MANNNSMVMDAAEQIFVSQQIQNVQTKVYEKVYPQLKARQLIPVDNTSDPSDIISFITYDRAGQAKILASYADDLPRVDVKGTINSVKAKSMGDAYGYNINEIRLANKLGVDLEQRKANAARDAFELLVDSIGAVGDTNYGLQGLFSIANAQTYTVPNGGSGFSTWATKTPAEILADIVGALAQMRTVTNDIESIDTLILPVGQAFALQTTPRTSTDSRTLFEFIKGTVPNLEIYSWVKAKGAGAGGTDRAVFYRRDPDVLTLRITQEFEQLPPEKRNLEYVTDCHGRIAGVIAHRPLAIIYADGI